MPGIHRVRTTIASVVIGLLCAACMSAEPTSTSTAGPPSASPVAATPASSPAPVATSDDVSGPPTASLAAEGGDPVTGQLGTYIWADGGSDSPWLPGAPIKVGAGEPLTIAFRPEIGIDTWAARAVRSTASGPAGATALGDGAGAPRFQVTKAGSWTIEVHVVFADGAGNASYFWQVTAS